MRSPENEAEELQAKIALARQDLRAGPCNSDEQRRNLKALISEGLPAAVERLQRNPMSIKTAELVARVFATVQEFIDICLRSPLLNEGPTRLDLSPLLYTLRVLLTVEQVPPRYHKPAIVTNEPINHFNCDHGRPLMRTYQGQTKRFWPDDTSSIRVGADAVGWSIEVHDVSGELAHHVLPTLPSDASSSPLLPAFGNTWHRVTVVECLSCTDDGRGTGGVDLTEELVDRDASAHGKRSTARGSNSPPRSSTTNSSNGGVGNINGNACGARGDGRDRPRELSLFRVEFDNGDAAALDLSRYSIKWVSIDGDQYPDTARGRVGVEGGGGGSGGGSGGVGGSRGRNRVTAARSSGKVDADGAGELLPRLPPGFTGLENTGPSLRNDDNDAGLRVDVWWPRYNSYFRGTIERYNLATKEHALYYDDGERHSHDMAKRGFVIVGRVRQHSGSRSGTRRTAAATKGSPGSPALSPEKKRLLCLAPRPPPEFCLEATTCYVFAALNRFGEVGGMTPLAQRLSSGWAPFPEVLETLRLGRALRLHASSRAMKEVNWTLKECAPAALLSVPPESMRGATKEEMAECVSSVRDLALTINAQKAVPLPTVLTEELEQLELGLAMKVFRCPSLERRLAGLMHICARVTLAEQRETKPAANSSSPPNSSEDGAWVTASAMEEWLVEVGFLEELFGSSMHIELVRASALRFGKPR